MYEPPRVCRTVKSVRGWCYDKANEVSGRVQRESGKAGIRAGKRIHILMENNTICLGENGLHT